MSEEENYIIENETQDTKKKQEYWNTGIGLNKVDNLEPSKYLIDLSKKNINGELKYSEVENLLKTYYENNSNKTITNMTLQVKYKNTDTVEDINISGLVSSGEKSKEVLIVGPDSRLVEDVEILKYKISIEDGVYMEYNPITSEYNWS